MSRRPPPSRVSRDCVERIILLPLLLLLFVLILVLVNLGFVKLHRTLRRMTRLPVLAIGEDFCLFRHDCPDFLHGLRVVSRRIQGRVPSPHRPLRRTSRASVFPHVQVLFQSLSGKFGWFGTTAGPGTVQMSAVADSPVGTPPLGGRGYLPTIVPATSLGGRRLRGRH